MAHVNKVFVILMATAWSSEVAKGETIQRGLTGQQSGLELIHLGNFGPISRLSSHPSFAHLGLTAQQTVGLTNILLQNGFLDPRALRLANGQPFLGEIYSSPVLPRHFYGIPGLAIDPYIFFLLSNYARYLPYGLGPHGIYGSTGLPKPQPLAVFKHEKH